MSHSIKTKRPSKTPLLFVVTHLWCIFIHIWIYEYKYICMCYHKYVRSPWICPFLKSSTGCSPFDPSMMSCSWVDVSQVDPAWTRHPWACDPRRQWGTWTSHPPRPDAVDSRHRETWDATGTTCFFPSNWNKWIFLADNKSGTHMHKYKHKGLGGCFLLAEKDQCMCGIMLSFPFWGWKIVMIQSNASKS